MIRLKSTAQQTRSGDSDALIMYQEQTHSCRELFDMEKKFSGEQGTKEPCCLGAFTGVEGDERVEVTNMRWIRYDKSSRECWDQKGLLLTGTSLSHSFFSISNISLQSQRFTDINYLQNLIGILKHWTGVLKENLCSLRYLFHKKSFTNSSVQSQGEFPVDKRRQIVCSQNSL